MLTPLGTQRKHVCKGSSQTALSLRLDGSRAPRLAPGHRLRPQGCEVRGGAGHTRNGPGPRRALRSTPGPAARLAFARRAGTTHPSELSPLISEPFPALATPAGPFPPPVQCFSPGVAGPHSTVPAFPSTWRTPGQGSPQGTRSASPAGTRSVLQAHTAWGTHRPGRPSPRPGGPHARGECGRGSRGAASSRGTFCKEGRPGLDPGREKAASLGAMRAAHARRPPYTPTTCHSLTSRENSLPVTNTCAPRKRANLRCRAEWCRKN